MRSDLNHQSSVCPYYAAEMLENAVCVVAFASELIGNFLGIFVVIRIDYNKRLHRHLYTSFFDFLYVPVPFIKFQNSS